MLQRAIELLEEVSQSGSLAALEDFDLLRRIDTLLAEYDAQAFEQSQGDLAHAEFVRELARQIPPFAAVL